MAKDEKREAVLKAVAEAKLALRAAISAADEYSEKHVSHPIPKDDTPKECYDMIDIVDGSGRKRQCARVNIEEFERRGFRAVEAKQTVDNQTELLPKKGKSKKADAE